MVFFIKLDQLKQFRSKNVIFLSRVQYHTLEVGVFGRHKKTLKVFVMKCKIKKLKILPSVVVASRNFVY